ncbi:MAG: S8 family serine peptidase [Bacteroidota bacterium]
MKKQTLTLILLIFSSLLFAQKKDRSTTFKTGDFKTEKNILKGTFKKEKIGSGLYKDNYFVLVEFSTLPSEKMQNRLKALGLHLENYISGTSYLASIKKEFDFTAAKMFGISSIDTIATFYKKDKKLIGKFQNKKITDQYLAISYYSSVDQEIIEAALVNIGAKIFKAKHTTNSVIFIEPDETLIDTIAAFPFVKYINLQVLKDRQLNYNDIAIHGISGLNAAAGKNLNGCNVTIGVGDNAEISSHIDFAGRLINRNPWYPDDHGIHTAGTATGAGIINVKNKGMAPKATIISQFFSDIVTNAPAYVVDNDLVITNNSYTASEEGCDGEGDYDVLSELVDKQTLTHPNLLHVFAAGNDGDNTCSPFPPFFGTTASGWQCAKNILTIGAIASQENIIAPFSARGPVNDGRIKPEICAAGFGIISSIKNNQYGIQYGTSMASPVVTGVLALMYERYRQLHSNTDPSAVLMKSIICNTAEDFGNPGPDYTYGFGVLNARRAVTVIDSSKYFIDSLINNESKSHSIVVPPSTAQLKIMLCWADKEAGVNAATTLVNDLDLKVTNPSNTVIKPFILNPTPANVNNVAVQGEDHLNNIEQVVINNPASGTYSASVNGFSIPFGKQGYVLTYEIVKQSIVVEYPFGGETLVPGEQETIRWNAYGSNGNQYTIQYSSNNGSSWTKLDSTISSTTRKFAWTVPATVTNSALIKISENNTSVTDQSDLNFSVLGQPVVTATSVCEGAVQLTWKTIAGATSYDVLKLNADSMLMINTVTDTTALVTGLNKNFSYWFGVRAKNGTDPGRRSISVNIIPNSGGCTLTAFYNDIKVDSILDPSTARKLFANASTATRPVKVRIKNNGDIATITPFTVSYSVNGTLTGTEIVALPIPAHSSIIYTFIANYTIPPGGYNYNFKAWTNSILDPNTNNDTAYKTVKQIANDPITSFPVVEDFEAMPIAEFNIAEMAIGGNQRIDFSANSSKGRARTFVNTGFARSGNRALTLDQSPFSEESTVDSLTFTYNFSSQIGNQLRYDFYYKNHGQSEGASNAMWIRGSENDSWVMAYDLLVNQAELGQWAHAVININDVLNNAVPSQIVSATTQIRFGEEGTTSANSPVAETDIDDGYTFDDITLKQAINDISLLKILSPSTGSCVLSSSEQISVEIKNYVAEELQNILVSYQINNGTVVTETIATLDPFQVMNYTFTQTADFSAYADYSIKAWVKYIDDNYPENDSVLSYKIHTAPLISNFPYLQGFETNDGNFYTKGTNTSWQWGTPAKTKINKAANGNRAWVTKLVGNYNNNETSYLYSPCFDISGLSQPVLSFSHIFDIEFGYDYTWVEYSTDGITWLKLGNVGEGVNWYDGVSSNSWKASKSKWHVASIDLPVTETVVRFRFVLTSDGGLTQNGVGIDDVHLFDKALIYSGIPLTNITQNVSGTGWVNYTAVGRMIASINPNGNNLGPTKLQVYPYTGIVRNSNGQYYANRNIVLQSTHSPISNVSIRLYFTGVEADSLINATGCSTCIKPDDAYELGVTEFSGNINNENETIDDNFSGYYNFITPANTQIIPYDNGYYAQFDVNNLSEFWLSKASIAQVGLSTCVGSTIVFKTSMYGTSYQWQVNNGSGYTNISNGVNYSGVTTGTLQLINLPASFSGYKYRCVVNGVNGPDNVVKFTNIWTGGINADWFTASNWSCNAVPDQYTDVIIPNGLTNYPIINANTSIKSIRVNNNASVTLLPGFNMDVLGK